MKSLNRGGLPGRLALTVLLAATVSACSVVGPKSIANGRLTYNQAIRQTESQQILMAILNNRYEEKISLLSVSSITANVSVTASSGVQLGFGDNDTYDGNLVPFGAGVVYEENPTISYLPVEGDKYSLRIMSPTPVEALARLANNILDPSHIYYALISDVNGIYNPSFQRNGEKEDARFERFVEIMTQLGSIHRLVWLGNPGQPATDRVVINRTDGNHEALAKELLEILGLPDPSPGSDLLILPFSLSIDGRPEGSIGITTRSTWGLVQIMSGAVQVPEADLQSGAAVPYPPPGRIGKQLKIHYSIDAPENAAVAVQYRDGWFYVDERDYATKSFFRLLGTMWGAAIAASDAGNAPMLTVPVSN